MAEEKEPKEFFSMNTKNWDTALIELNKGNYSEGKDYFFLGERKTGPFGLGGIVKRVSTDNPEVKTLLENNGAKKEGKVELHVIVPKKKEEILVELDASRYEVIDAIQANSNFRHQLDFEVEKNGKQVRIYPAGDNAERWDELYALLNSPESPIALANLKEKPKQKVKG